MYSPIKCCISRVDNHTPDYAYEEGITLIKIAEAAVGGGGDCLPSYFLFFSDSCLRERSSEQGRTFRLDKDADTERSWPMECIEAKLRYFPKWMGFLYIHGCSETSGGSLDKEVKEGNAFVVRFFFNHELNRALNAV